MDVRKLCDEIKPTLDKYKDEEYIELEFRLGKFNSSFFDTNIGKENFYKFLDGLQKFNGLGKVENIEKLEKSWLLSIKWQNKNFSKYIVEKGSICVNGISLTVAKSENQGEIFTIAIIPHTWHNTNLKNLSIGDNVNLEGDALIKYVEKLLLFNNNKDSKNSANQISSNWLKENGWNK